MTRYLEAFSWDGRIDRFLAAYATETPMLHVCSGRSNFGTTTVDLYEPADVRADWTALPFPDDSYAAVFADPPWNSGYKGDVAAFMREAMRVAPVAYLMAPWLYGGALAPLTRCWVRQMPGVHTPILLSRYERGGRQLALADDSRERAEAGAARGSAGESVRPDSVSAARGLGVDVPLAALPLPCDLPLDEIRAERLGSALVMTAQLAAPFPLALPGVP